MTPAPIKPLVTLAAVEALDIRVGEIVGVENVAGSSKLVRLRVSFGDHTRTILAGLRRGRGDPAGLARPEGLFLGHPPPERDGGGGSGGVGFRIRSSRG